MEKRAKHMRQTMHSFDTYKHINELKAAGFEEKQAAVIIKSLVESRETDISNLATKEQVSEIKTQVAVIEHRVSNIEKTMATKEELKDVQITLIKWMVGLMIAFTGIILAGFQLLK
jgi:capsule polysaccharide export protein KpsE/RkpR